MTDNSNQSRADRSGLIAQKEPKFSGSFFRFASTMIVMVVLGIVASFVWQNYFSPQAKESRRLEEQYKQYEAFEAAYKKAMTEDTYGGKTPQETLNLFVKALEQGDLELASKYFALNSAGQRDEKWLVALRKLNDENRVNGLINFVKSSVLSEQSEVLNTAFFATKNNFEEVTGEIFLKLNTYSNVWKIESI